MTMIENNNDFEIDFEDSFKESLKSLGHLFPINDNEVNYFESINKIKKTPDNFKDAYMLLSKEKVSFINSSSNPITKMAVENLARAARNGNKIPDDILKRMKEDRNKIDNGK